VEHIVVATKSQQSADAARRVKARRQSGPVTDVVREAIRLATDPQLVVLDGFHCVKHAIRFDAELVLLVTTDRAATLDLADSLAPDVVERLRAELVSVNPSLAGRLRGVDPGSELIGFARRPVPGSDATRRSAPAVLLDNPRNLANLGAVVRVAAGFGASAVLSTGSVDPWHPAVVRAGAGLHFAITVRRITPEDPALAGQGQLFAFDPSGEDLREIELPDDALLAFGSERHGLSAAVRRRADRLVSIPMAELVSSYNLATSVAVGLYHWSAGRARPAGR
jgi:TrmH family RNA methyltransferase